MLGHDMQYSMRNGLALSRVLVGESSSSSDSFSVDEEFKAEKGG